MHKQPPPEADALVPPASLDALLHALAAYESVEDVFNPYEPHTVYGRVRLENLRRFLRHRLSSGAMLVMEAPGYRGCRVTGIPVTSRRVMSSPLLHGGLFAPMPDEQVEPAFRPYASEQSATIVWHTLADLPVKPLLWNAFPFHPHPAGEPAANRTPRPVEVKAGQRYLRAVLALAAPDTVVAVGNVAGRALAALGVAHHTVRHPAQGGKNDFVRGLHAVLR